MTTTTTKDITQYLDVKGIDYNPIQLSALLSKLDWEELEDLLGIIEDSYDKGFEEGEASW
jgi:ribosomal protein L12E/L44/L45/RPP1/RPP2